MSSPESDRTGPPVRRWPVTDSKQLLTPAVTGLPVAPSSAAGSSAAVRVGSTSVTDTGRSTASPSSRSHA